MKKYFIVGIFDDESHKKVQKLQEAIRVVDDQEMVPAHLTLADYDKEIDPEVLMAWLDELETKVQTTNVHLTSLGLLAARQVFGGVRHSKELLELYNTIHDRYDDYCSEFTSLNSGRGWFPHIGLSYGSPEELTQIMGHLASLRIDELELKIERLTLSEAEGQEVKSIKDLKSIALK